MRKLISKLTPFTVFVLGLTLMLVLNQTIADGSFKGTTEIIYECGRGKPVLIKEYRSKTKRILVYKVECHSV